jgi:small subunit ribosomal protein S16
MLKIRFVRVGKKNKPFFRIAVGDSKRTPKGKFIEKLGYYNPLKKEKSINKERVLHWISNGAQCSDTVHNLLVSLEIIKGPKRKIKIKSKKSADTKAATDEKKEEAKKEIKTEEVKESAAEVVKDGKETAEKIEEKPKEKVKENKTEETQKETIEKKKEEAKEEKKEEIKENL